MTPQSSNFACLLSGRLVKRFDNGLRVAFNLFQRLQPPNRVKA
jgi:hypothetical protein